jgi:hypothetical protein
MKIARLFILIAILMLLPAYSYSSPLGQLRISLIEGDVQILTEDTEDWVLASINMPLRDGDQIWVPEGGRAEIQINDGSILRLDEQSALEILTIEKDLAQFYLTEGRAYANFRGLKGSFLQMDTPVSSLRAYGRSIFRIDVMREGATDLSVYQGSIYAESHEGRTTVDQGKVLSVGEGRYAEIGSLGPSDEWERWNKERDRRLTRRSPSRYLPEDLYAYSSDFEENGRWVNVREYGYVWTPTVVVSVGWAPYRIGRWVWVGGDYVWISDEPWGWVPYHYGRWAFVASIGWCWVPPARGAIYWGPGYVGWVHTPTHVSWVPLAPGEIYYGHGNYGPHSVNITKVNIHSINASKVVYKNVHVHNSVTIVHNDTFIRGKHVEVKVKENPFLREKISIGRPDLKPEKATRSPIHKEIREDRRPPEPIRKIEVKELKEKRPPVKEREVSVFKPELPPKQMTIKAKEAKPEERDIGKAGERKPVGKGLEKPGVTRPVKKEQEKPKEFKPPEKVERTGPPGKEAEKPKDYKPTEKREKPKEMKPPERLPEKNIEKTKESKPSGQGERSREIRGQEKSADQPGEMKPMERAKDKTKEMKSVEKEAEKAGEFRERKGSESK